MNKTNVNYFSVLEDDTNNETRTLTTVVHRDSENELTDILSEVMGERKRKREIMGRDNALPKSKEKRRFTPEETIEKEELELTLKKLENLKNNLLPGNLKTQIEKRKTKALVMMTGDRDETTDHTGKEEELMSKEMKEQSLLLSVNQVDTSSMETAQTLLHGNEISQSVLDGSDNEKIPEPMSEGMRDQSLLLSVNQVDPNSMKTAHTLLNENQISQSVLDGSDNEKPISVVKRDDSGKENFACENNENLYDHRDENLKKKYSVVSGMDLVYKEMRKSPQKESGENCDTPVLMEELEEKRRKERQRKIDLFDSTRRRNRQEKSDRRNAWPKWISATNLLKREKENEEKFLPPEKRKVAAKLALRLQMNGIALQETESIPDGTYTDPRTHPSRANMMPKEPTLCELIRTPEVVEEIKNWNHETWTTMQVASVESELPLLDNKGVPVVVETTRDSKPILYAKVKGVMAKIYVDQGAQVSVISENFAHSNGLPMSVLREPVKLCMANGILEPTFNKVHMVSISIKASNDTITGQPAENDHFSEKINAYVAPIKGYDIILGRDNLMRWGGILDMRSAEDIMQENLLENNPPLRMGNPYEELSVFDKKRGKRITLRYGENNFTSKEIFAKSLIHERELDKILNKDEEVFLYEILVEEKRGGNTLRETSRDEQSEKERELEERLKKEFSEILKEELPNELPPDRGIRHYIDTQGRLPRQSPRGFRMSVAENEFMEKHIQELLDKGLVSPTLGPFGSPILVVKKPHSTDLRCVIDYRKLNEVTVGDEYPQPLVVELLDKLKNAKYFSKMDLLSGFHQVRMAEEDKQKTAFTCPFGTFAFQVMPLGLKNASKTFQRMVEYVLREQIGKSVIVFIDDILVFSDTLEEHEQHIRMVLRRLKEEKLYLKPKKCEFFRREVSFLGHVVSFNEVKMDPRKVQVVKDWGHLETKKDVQRFLGFANFYRRFIENFAKIAEPLNALLCNTKDNAKVIMTKEAEDAQRKLIEMITNDPILKMYDGKKDLKIVTDASLHAVAATLMQKESDNKWYPVEFQSRALEGNKEKRSGEYSLAPRDLELCGISYALSKFRPYVAGRKFTVISDHKSLETLETSKINSGRLARIIEQLSEFDFSIEYKEGTSPVISIVDALSRLPRYRRVEEDLNEVALCEIFGMDVKGDKLSGWGISALKADEDLVHQVKEGYSSDEYFMRLIENLRKMENDKGFSPPKELKFLLGKFSWDEKEKLLYKNICDKQVLCIPRSGRLIVDRLFEAHDTTVGGHLGRDKTLANVAKNFFWPGMVRDVDQYVASCGNCQSNKGIKRLPLGLLYPHERPQRRWEKISLDFIVQLPKTKVGNFDAILTVVDQFSKRMHFIPCQGDVDALGTAKLLRENVIKLHGYPKYIISDRDPKFTSGIWKELFSSLGVKQNLSSSFHPQTDGSSEKANDMIECCIRAFTNYQQDDWNTFLPEFELGINSAKSDASGLSPQFLDTGLEPFVPLGLTYEVDSRDSVTELVERMNDTHVRAQVMFAKAQEKQALYANTKRGDEEFQVGDFVMLNSDFVYDPIHTDRPKRKLCVKWLGPFRIEKKVSRVAYKLFLPAGDNLKIHPVVHIANLKKFVVNPEKFLERKELSVPEPMKDSQGETVYAVDEILNVKIERKKRFFLVKWTGYDDPSWEPEELLRESKDFESYLDEYLDEVVSGRRLVLKRSRGRNMKARIK